MIALIDGLAVSERGEVYSDIPELAKTARSSVWVTIDPVALLLTLTDAFGEIEAFTYQLIESAEVTRLDGAAYIDGAARLTRFGFKCRCSKEWRAAVGCTCGCPPKRKDALHIVWSPGDMSKNPGEYIEHYTHQGLLKFATDVRDWCKEQNVPLPTSLAGIANALLRDARFWPHARGRVPKATNERMRPHLPGVYSELRARTRVRHQAVAIDQRTAYHRAAQEITTPDPTTLFARGYFTNPDTGPLWAVRGDTLYERTIRQPGLVTVQYSARHAVKNEVRPPWVQAGRNRATIYTNEVTYAESVGVHIDGIIAAWTSSDADTGLPKYGAWAEERINEADAYRRKWLKPTLHALYGLLAMRQRTVTVGHLRGNAEPHVFLLGNSVPFTIPARTLPEVPAATVNVPMLGVLQAEIRTRSLAMASNLIREGAEVLHIHADGIHVAGPMPLLPPDWSVKPQTNLEYIDNVSWVSDERDVLPGRDAQERIELRRHIGRLMEAARDSLQASTRR